MSAGAALAWRAELDARLRPLNLTPPQFLRMMTSRVIRTWEDAGLLARQAHETDGTAGSLP
jgi:hypothetical protein